MKQDKLHIRVQNMQPYMALQDYTRQVIEAVNKGYVLAESIDDHARVLNQGDYSVTLTKAVPYSAEDVVVTFDGVEVEGFSPTELAPITPEMAQQDVLDELVSESEGNGEYTEQLDKFDTPKEEHKDSDDDSYDVDLDKLKTTKELKDYAKSAKISVPRNKKTATTIRNYLKSLG